MSNCVYFIEVNCVDLIGFEYPVCCNCEVIE